MANEFVILRHSGYGPVHYDLMLRRGEVLATWQLSVDPRTMAPDQNIAARQLPDHRLAYLDYEGPVSRGRGHVERVWAGTYRSVAKEAARWEMQLHGQEILAQFELGRGEDDLSAWRLRRIN